MMWCCFAKFVDGAEARRAGKELSDARSMCTGVERVGGLVMRRGGTMKGGRGSLKSIANRGKQT